MAESHAAAPHAHAPTPEAQGGGHATVRTYVNVAVALAILTAVEVTTLYIPGIPNWFLITALLAMSVLKFFLVVGFFMHLKYDSSIMRALFVGPLIIAIAIILALMALFSAYILLPRVVS
jgi:cytochrome c oxidase subunit 4